MKEAVGYLTVFIYIFALIFPVGNCIKKKAGVEVSRKVIHIMLILQRYVIKGDLHMHTTYSDGLESPDHRIAIARQCGMDFLAITDHNGYSGSERAVNLNKRFFNNVVCIHGEEVHAPHCPVHILSLGANQSISKQIREEQSYHETISRLADEAAKTLPADVDTISYIAAQDVFQRITRADGVSVLCHIYWDSIDTVHGKRMGAPEQLIDELVANRRFDVFEITSGAPFDDLRSNYLQDAYWREKLQSDCPIIGITDSHTSLTNIGSIMGKNYSIVFAEQFDEKRILNAILQGMSVSVDGVSGTNICHGSLRLCKYAAFLLEEFFPFHDKIVFVEGELMERALSLSTTALGQLETVCEDSHSLIAQEWKPIYPPTQSNTSD